MSLFANAFGLTIRESLVDVPTGFVYTCWKVLLKLVHSTHLKTSYVSVETFPFMCEYFKCCAWEWKSQDQCSN